MKLMIDISEDVYKYIQQRSAEIQAEGYVLECAVLNGTPLDNVLDEIGEEIEQKAKDYDEVLGYRDSRGLWIALGLLNKYKDKREETR